MKLRPAGDWFYFNRKKKRNNRCKKKKMAPGELLGKNSKPVDNNMPKWRECTQSAATNSVVVKHIQNNVCSRQTWFQSCSQAQFSPSTHQLNVSVKGQNPKRDLRYRGPQISQAYPTRVPRQITWSGVMPHGCCSKSCDTEASFTSDHLPQTGFIIFDGASETSRAPHRLASCAPAEKSTNVTASHHVGEMLRQIRRELAVGKPCRADREAPNQMVEMAGAETPQLAGGALSTDGEQAAPPSASAASTAVQPAPGGFPVLCPDSGAGPSRVAPEESTASKTGQEGGETGGVGPGRSGETSGPPNRTCAPADPDANLCKRVRIAHKPKQGLEAKQAASRLIGKRKRPEGETDIPR